MNFDLVIPQNYNIDSPHEFSGAHVSLAVTENISPSTYLDFAIKDFEIEQDERSNVNAFANAKRAIHFQADIISAAFGIDHLPKNLRDNFPKKMNFCEQCGIVGSRILNKYNILRNKVEHDYYLPQRAEVEDIIDIAQLFLTATARFISQFPSDIEVALTPKINNTLPKIAGIEFPPSDGIIYLFPDIIELVKRKEAVDNIVEWQRNNSIKFSVNQNKQYFEWVKFLVSNTQ